MKSGVQHIVEDFSRLPLNDREYVVDVVKRQLVVTRRDAIAKRATTASSNLKKGAIRKGSVKDLHEDIEHC